MQQQDYNRQNSPKKKINRLRQAEDRLETKIEQIYSECVGHSLKEVHCAFLITSDLYIHMDGVVSPSEVFLTQQGSRDLAIQMRHAINQIVQGKINEALEQDLSVKADKARFLKPERKEQLNVLVRLYL